MHIGHDTARIIWIHMFVLITDASGGLSQQDAERAHRE
jgi:hypothetical protein